MQRALQELLFTQRGLASEGRAVPPTKGWPGGREGTAAAPGRRPPWCWDNYVLGAPARRDRCGEEEAAEGGSWVACQARAWEQEGRGPFPEGDAGWRHQAMRVDQSATRAERPGLRPPSPICLPPLPPPALTTCPPGLPCSLLSSQGSWDLVTGPSASPRTLPTHTRPTLSAFLPSLKGPPAPGPQLSGNSEFQAYGVTWGICSQADMIQIRPPSELVTLGKLPDHSELQVPHR